MYSIDYEELIPKLKRLIKSAYPKGEIFRDDGTYNINGSLGKKIKVQMNLSGAGYVNNLDAQKICFIIIDLSKDDPKFVKILKEVCGVYFNWGGDDNKRNIHV